MTSLLAALLLGTSGITFQERAMPLGKLVDTLAERLGRSLSVQAGLAKEWIVVDAVEADPDELLDRIAEVTFARWEEEGSQMRLRRDPAMDREMARAAAVFHAGELRKEIRRKRLGFQGDYEFDALYDLLLDLPLEDLLDDITRYGITFSDAPTGSQRRFPPAVAKHVERILREGGKLAGEPQAPPAGISLILMPFDPLPLGFSLAVHLVQRDEAGHFGSAISRLYHSPTPPKLSFTAQERSEVIQVSPLNAELDPAWPRIPLRKLSAEAQEVILNPERGGRLAHIWTEVARAFARREGRMLVANLPEPLEHRYAFDYRQPITLASVKEALDGMTIQTQGKWLTLRPQFAIPLATPRPDRAFVGKALRKVAAGNPLTFADAAGLVGPDGKILSHYTSWCDEAHPLAMWLTTPIRSDTWGLRLYQSLTPASRNALREGQVLEWNRLPTAAQAFLRERYLLKQDDERLHPITSTGYSEWSDMKLRQAVITPADLPNLRISAEETETVRLLLRNAAHPEAYDSYDLYQLNKMADGDWRPLPDPSRATHPTFDQARPYRHHKIVLRVTFPAYKESVWMEEIAFYPGEGFVPLAKLSPWVKRLARPPAGDR